MKASTAFSMSTERCRVRFPFISETVPDSPTLNQLLVELIVDKGYHLEEHFVTTADGYVLGTYRIPFGKVKPSLNKTVLLWHGLLDCSATWALNEPNESLAFILADAGYDVWMSNSRGDAFSRNHTGLDPGSAAFWDFSYDEMAKYDVQAVVDYVLSFSGERQLAYVGHSQGTTIALAAMSENKRLQEQLSIAILLGPAAFASHVSSKAMIFLADLHTDQIFNLLGALEFLPNRKSTADVFGEICQTVPLACISIITAICGFSTDNIDTRRLPQYVRYAPSGTSVRAMAHWAQAVRHSLPTFQKYDWGTRCWTARGTSKTCNQRMYGLLKPPLYNLSTIVHVPIALLYGGNDELADPIDVYRLMQALPDESIVWAQRIPRYAHLDFTWGETAHLQVYPSVLHLLDTY